MRVQVDTPNPAMDEKVLSEIQVNNTKAIAQAVNKTGVNQSLLVQSTTQTNFTSTTYAVPLDMQGVVTSSGGFFSIEFKSSLFCPSTRGINVQLLIDDEVKDHQTISSSADVVVPFYLTFKGTLGNGRHKIKIQATINAGTAVFSQGSTLTQLQATEILL